MVLTRWHRMLDAMLGAMRDENRSRKFAGLATIGSDFLD